MIVSIVSRMLKNIALLLLKFYRNGLSPLKLQSCRFYPSCSEYAVTAIEKYGLLRGMFAAARRIIKCHPFSAGGYDPVK